MKDLLLPQEKTGLVLLLDGLQAYNWGILYYNKEMIGRYSLSNLGNLSKKVLEYGEEIKVLHQSKRYAKKNNFDFGGAELDDIEIQVFSEWQLQDCYETLISKGGDKKKVYWYCLLINALETNTAEAFPSNPSFLEDIKLKDIKALIKKKENMKINEYLLYLDGVIRGKRKYFYQILNYGVSKEIFYRCLKN